MSFATRPPALSDASTIADLHVSTWRETYARLLPADFFDERQTEERRELWRRVLADPRDDWVVRIAESDDAVIGFAVVGPSASFADRDTPRARQLYSIYVAVSHQGLGAGQALLDAALASEPAMLWATKQSPRAIAFYRRNGFEFDGAERVDPGTPTIIEARMLR